MNILLLKNKFFFFFCLLLFLSLYFLPAPLRAEFGDKPSDQEQLVCDTLLTIESKCEKLSMINDNCRNTLLLDNDGKEAWINYRTYCGDSTKGCDCLDLNGLRKSEYCQNVLPACFIRTSLQPFHPILKEWLDNRDK